MNPSRPPMCRTACCPLRERRRLSATATQRNRREGENWRNALTFLMERQIYIHETVGIRFREAAPINEVDMAQTSLWRRKRKKKKDKRRDGKGEVGTKGGG